MPLSNLTAYTSVAENSAATPGLFDSRFNTVHANIQAVDTTVSQVSLVLSSVSGSGISGLRDVTLVRYGGAIGDGTTDDRAAFNTGNTSTATQAVLYAPSTASVYRIASAVTLSGTYSPIRGAILRPTSGTTIYHRGGIDAGPYPIWDLSLGGGVDFTGNREIPHFLAQWFGVKGDDATDDQPALARMINCLPDYSTVVFPGGMVMRLGSTWTITSRKGIRLLGATSPFPDAAGHSVVFKWSGATGGDMIAVRSCGYMELGHFQVATDLLNVANRGVICDETGVNGVTGTACRFHHLYFYNVSANSSLVHLDINPIAGSNQEYHDIQYCVFNGGPGTFGSPDNYRGNIATSGVTVTVNGALFKTFWSGQSYRLRIPLAGVAGALYDGVVATSGTTNLVAFPTIPTSVTSTRAFIGEGKGMGIRIGANANTKKIVIKHNQLYQYNHAIDQNGGSIHIEDNSFTDNETNWYRLAASEPCTDDYSNVEQSRQHIYQGPFDVKPLQIRNARFGGLGMKPYGGWIESASNDFHLHVENCLWDDSPPDVTSTIYYFTNAGGGALLSQDNYYPFFAVGASGSALTLGGLGFFTGVYGASVLRSINDRNISNASATDFCIGTNKPGQYTMFTTSSGGVEQAAISGVGEHDGNTNTIIGLRGGAESSTGAGGGNSTLVGVQGDPATSNLWSVLVDNTIAFRAKMPAITTPGSQHLLNAYGLKVESPPLPVTGGITNVFPVFIASQMTTGMVNTYGLVQSGLSDTNVLNGPSVVTSGLSTLPSVAFSSESSLGFYRSGAATIAPSMGTLNLATNAVRLSVRTLGSGDSTNIAVNEALFIIAGASGASIGIRSGGTIYYFASSLSTKG